MIRIMVADDNKDLNDFYCKTLAKDKEIKIISQTTDGKETLEKYLELKPDILLLDLKMPTINGIEIINTLSKDPNEKEIKNIFVISGSDTMRMKLWQMSKVYLSIAKPLDLDILLMKIKEFIKEKENRTRDISKKDIDDYLSDISIQTQKKNTIILTEAIFVAYKRTYLLRNINDLYEYVGEHNNKSSTVVQWSIRNSIRSINKNISDDKLYTIFHLPKEDRSIAPKYFFTTTVEYLRNK